MRRTLKCPFEISNFQFPIPLSAIPSPIFQLSSCLALSRSVSLRLVTSRYSGRRTYRIGRRLSPILVPSVLFVPLVPSHTSVSAFQNSCTTHHAPRSTHHAPRITPLKSCEQPA